MSIKTRRVVGFDSLTMFVDQALKLVGLLSRDISQAGIAGTKAEGLMDEWSDGVMDLKAVPGARAATVDYTRALQKERDVVGEDANVAS
ncbi:MAG: hypothetical protein HY674_20720 [Chloroflexi bacterium]|nr:hypothetical protein [Chloroflexota bacterium]